MKRLAILSSAALFFILFLFFSFFAFAQGTKRMRPVPHVDVYRVGIVHNKPVLITYPARLKSYKVANIVAQVDGVILKRYFKEGSHVKKGQVLFRIDPSIYAARVSEAEAEVEKAKAVLYKARRDYVRYKNLYAKNAVSKEKLDDVTSAYKNALASLMVAKASLRAAEVDLKHTDVRATISGIAGEKLLSVGDYARVGERLVTIKQTNRIYAYFSFPSSDIELMRKMEALGRWKELKPCRAIIYLDGKLYRGIVDYTDSSIDPSTSTLKARAVFKNSGGSLMPGEFVRIKVSCALQKSLLFVPSEAVIQMGNNQIVFVVSHGRVSVRPVKTREVEGGFIVMRGLKPGDLVVVDNLFRMRPGEPVKIDRIINK